MGFDDFKSKGFFLLDFDSFRHTEIFKTSR